MDRIDQFRYDFQNWGEETQFRITEHYAEEEGNIENLATADALGFLVKKCLEEDELFNEVYTHYLHYFAENLAYTDEDIINYKDYRLFIYNREKTPEIGSLVKLTYLPNTELIPKDIWCTVVSENVAKDRKTGNLIKFHPECIKTKLTPPPFDFLED